jgi:prepilin-type N-terminal cleavage/methylation domain-containing protein
MLRDSHGFSLIEVLVATGVLVTVAAGGAQLFAVAIHHDIAARQQLAMSIAAASKIEEVAALAASTAPPASAIGAVDRAVAGYVDTAVVAGATFERRWMVAPLGGYSTTAVVIVVRVVSRVSHSSPDFEIASIRKAAAP